MTMVEMLKTIINRFNIDIIKYPNADLRSRKKLLNHFKINKILDVGANSGQYAQLIRKLGFKGEIISFEPLSIAYKILEKNALKDKKWKVYNLALGNKEEEVTINISENIYSSSMLSLTPKLLNSAPETTYIDKEKISVKTLDILFDSLVKEGDKIFLKIDVQGFEKNVLEGAEKVLHKIKGIQIEMSIVELYHGEMLFDKMLDFLETKGFKLYSLENGFCDNNTGQLLQVDGIFFRD